MLIRYYTAIAARRAIRNRTVDLVNIIGLAIGMACCILAIAFVRYHHSWDAHQTHSDRIFRVLFATENGVWKRTIGPLGPALVETFPEVESAVRIRSVPAWAVTPDAQFQTRMAVADPSILTVFDYHLLAGDPETALRDPFSVVVTESAAIRWFGHTNVVGRTLRIESYRLNGDYRISGISRDLPPNTSPEISDFDIVSTTRVGQKSGESEGRRRAEEARWEAWDTGGNLDTFVLLRSPSDTGTLEDKIAELVRSRMGEEASTYRHPLQPLEAIHLYSGSYGLKDADSALRAIWLVSGIAGLILVVACINFVNLSTARIWRRQKEVGVRKASGAMGSDLYTQFISESILTVGAASVIGLLTARVAAPFLRSHGGLDMPDAILAGNIGPVLLLMAGVALLSSIYPTYATSRIRPVLALRGGHLEGNDRFRKGLAVTQFATCILLIVGTVIIYGQTAYLTDRGLGFDHAQIVTMPIFSLDAARKDRYNDLLSRRWRTLKSQLLAHPNILSAAVHQNKPGLWEWGGANYRANGKEIWLPTIGVDEDFVELYGLELIKGRHFDGSTTPGALRKSGEHHFILNETAARALGWEDPLAAVGKPLGRARWANTNRRGTVIGIVRDFHVRDLRHPIDPLVLYYDLSTARFMAVKIRPEGIAQTLGHLEAWWEELLPERPFDYRFLDAEIGRRYSQERQTATLMGCFSVLGIALGCMGLFALTSFVVERRIREVGIRKCLGASVSSIVLGLSRESGWVQILANALAWPIGFYFLSSWLSQFQYRIDLHIGYFLLAGGAAGLVAFLTVALQVVPAARANPVASLRHE